MPSAPTRARRATLLVLGLLALGACKAGTREAAAERAPTPAQPSSAASGGETVATAVDSTALRAAADSGRILGNPSAKVWLIEVSDFQCPYCKMWHDQSYEALRKEYVESGKVRMAYLNFPLDQHVQALPAAEAAMCAAVQKKFWEYQSALFRSQDTWGKSGDQSKFYDSLATTLGMNLPNFRACTQSHVMRALIEADKDRMLRAGVQSTPSFFVGSRGIAGAQPTPVFREALDAALGAPAKR